MKQKVGIGIDKQGGLARQDSDSEYSYVLQMHDHADLGRVRAKVVLRSARHVSGYLEDLLLATFGTHLSSS